MISVQFHSLTARAAEILEGFTNRRFLHQVDEYIYHKQFARKGQSTSHALFIFYKLSTRLSIAEIPVSESSFQTFQRDLI